MLGHSKTDVLYIAFTGEEAVPGADGAKWNSKNFTQFQASLETLGKTLIKRIPNSNGNWSHAVAATPKWRME
jgi:hypothetical protein